MSDYGDRVAEAREQMGLTQPHFAAGAGIPQRTLQDIENGKVKRPQRRTREKIDVFLGLHREGEVAEEEWDAELKAFLDILGAYLWALSPTRRTATMHEMIRRLAQQDPT